MNLFGVKILKLIIYSTYEYYCKLCFKHRIVLYELLLQMIRLLYSQLQKFLNVLHVS
jgi:hypothetical protein